MNKWVSVAVVVALGMGCGGKDKTSPGLASFSSDAGATGGRHSTGGKTATSTAGVAGTAGGSAGGHSPGGSQSTGGASTWGGTSATDLAPTVTIISPTAVSDPSVGTVLVSQTVDVLCQATKSTSPGAADIAGSSVKIRLTPASGSPTEQTGIAVAGQANQYTASFSLSAPKVPSGPVSFQCQASDQSSSPHTGVSSVVSTFVDHGPLVDNVVPAKDASFPAKASVRFKFHVTPVPLSTGDSGAEIGEVSLIVNGRTYSVPVDSSVSGVYTQDVDFSDSTKFPQNLTGPVPVEIDVSNKRQNPQPAVAKVTSSITLDGTPPTITITSPVQGSIIGGLRQLSFDVTDDLSGVDPGFVFVNLGTDTATTALPYQFSAQDPAWTMKTSGSTTTFTFVFDSTKFSSTDSQVTISVKARDQAGNSTTSDSIFYYLDNAPPYISLDPPHIRYVTNKDATSFNCSESYDPIGTRPPGYGTIINSFEFYRAFALDRTNGKSSQTYFIYSGIDANRVHLYVQPDSTKRIVYDLDGDGYCDHIDPDVKGMDFQPAMNAVKETGNADFQPTDLTTAPDVTDLSWIAQGKTCGSTSYTPSLLCNGNSPDMGFVVHQPYATGNKLGNDAAVYALGVTPNTMTCTGSDWDISNFVPAEGWICIAAEAVDNVGNTGISAPIPLCFDNELTPTKPSCATGKRREVSTEKPPTCITDGCKPPSRSLDGDRTNSGDIVRYDIGNPIPFIIYAQ